MFKWPLSSVYLLFRHCMDMQLYETGYEYGREMVLAMVLPHYSNPTNIYCIQPRHSCLREKMEAIQTASGCTCDSTSGTCIYTYMGLLLTVAANHTTDESSVDGLSISLLLHQLQNTVGHLHIHKVHIYCTDAVTVYNYYIHTCVSIMTVCLLPVCACL